MKCPKCQSEGTLITCHETRGGMKLCPRCKTKWYPRRPRQSYDRREKTPNNQEYVKQILGDYSRDDAKDDSGVDAEDDFKDDVEKQFPYGKNWWKLKLGQHDFVDD